MAEKRISTYKPLTHIATQYNVSQNGVRRWHAIGAPLHSEELLAKWLLARDCVDHVRAEAERILGLPIGSTSKSNPEGRTRGEGDGVDELFAKLAAGRNVSADEIGDSTSRAELYRDFFSAKLEQAIRCEDRAEVDYYSKRHREYEDLVSKIKLTAKKLGIESGELLKKSDAEAYLRAVAYRLARCVDAARKRLREKLVLVPTPQAADAILDGELLGSVLLQPMAQALRVDGPTALPKWAHAAIVDAIDDYIEDGATLASSESQPEKTT